MKIRTSDLIGLSLDRAVAVCDGRKEPDLMDNFAVAWSSWGNSHYSTKWAMGGPIIERESISVLPFDDRWEARCACAIRRTPARFIERRGPTPLVAAMRCYVASKMGDEIEIPEV